MSPIDTAPIDSAAARSELIAHALAVATAAHAGQIRNGSGGLPYIEHPRMVAATLAKLEPAAPPPLPPTPGGRSPHHGQTSPRRPGPRRRPPPRRGRGLRDHGRGTA